MVERNQGWGERLKVMVRVESGGGRVGDDSRRTCFELTAGGKLYVAGGFVIYEFICKKLVQNLSNED